MNIALQKFGDDFSNVGGTGPSLLPSPLGTRHHSLPKSQSLPSLRLESRSKKWAGPIAVTLLALLFLGWDLPAELHFVDESAYLSQSYFADLWLTGHWNDVAWLEYPGYDLPPFPKYVIGLSLRAGGYRRPGPSAMRAWYRDTSSRFVSGSALVMARWPSVGFGMMGCLSLYAIGSMALDRRVGFLSAWLLMLNPLYCMHARRAMSDMPAESLILASLAFGIWGWKRLLSEARTFRPLLGIILGSGILGGLATLSKLNGSLSGLILGSWAFLAVGLPGFRWRSKFLILAASGLSGLISFATFSALNPFLFADPKGPIDPRLAPMHAMSFLERVKVVADHRVNVSNLARSSFPGDALSTPGEKVSAILIQGFGRFGHFGVRGWTDSTVRFDWDQDRGVLVWFPWVLAGLWLALVRGRRQLSAGQPPTAWALVVQVGISLTVVTAFIPLAWDRYFLSIQPGFALLGAVAVVASFDRVRPWLGRPVPTELPH